MINVPKITTVEDIYEFQFKEKGSLFIGQIYPVLSAEEADEILTAIRKEHYNATHHCYAYQLRNGDFRYSDDGEPNGTAGIRIYNALKHFNVSDALIISIRYFGGTKLGVGPLGKAYYYSAEETIKEATLVEKINYTKMRVKFGFDYTSQIHHFLGQVNAKITDNLFEEMPVIEFLILPEKIEKLTSDLKENSRGSISPEIIEEDLFLEEF